MGARGGVYVREGEFPIYYQLFQCCNVTSVQQYRIPICYLRLLVMYNPQIAARLLQYGEVPDEFPDQQRKNAALPLLARAIQVLRVHKAYGDMGRRREKHYQRCTKDLEVLVGQYQDATPDHQSALMAQWDLMMAEYRHDLEHGMSLPYYNRQFADKYYCFPLEPADPRSPRQYFRLPFLYTNEALPKLLPGYVPYSAVPMYIDMESVNDEPWGVVYENSPPFMDADECTSDSQYLGDYNFDELR